jgi:hypothetical protein
MVMFALSSGAGSPALIDATINNCVRAQGWTWTYNHEEAHRISQQARADRLGRNAASLPHSAKFP